MMSYTTENAARRIVKNGRVKIGGIYYYPKSPYGTVPYDGRFEGKKLLFRRYNEHHPEGLFYEPFVYLHPEDHYLNLIDEVFHWDTWWTDTDTMIQMLHNAPAESSYAHRLRLWILRWNHVNTDDEPRMSGEVWGDTLKRIFDRWLVAQSA